MLYAICYKPNTFSCICVWRLICIATLETNRFRSMFFYLVCNGWCSAHCALTSFLNRWMDGFVIHILFIIHVLKRILHFAFRLCSTLYTRDLAYTDGWTDTLALTHSWAQNASNLVYLTYESMLSSLYSITHTSYTYVPSTHIHLFFHLGYLYSYIPFDILILNADGSVLHVHV